MSESISNDAEVTLLSHIFYGPDPEKQKPIANDGLCVLDVQRDLNVLCYGGGVNSVALLFEAYARGIIFDAILMANPGAEHDRTYSYVNKINDWCKQQGQPDIKMVIQVNADGEEMNLYTESMDRGTLPAIAFGYKTCSQKYKRFPQDKFINNWPLAQSAWSNGYKVNRWIGYDKTERHRAAQFTEDDKYRNIYLLIDIGWDRYFCEIRILNEGYPIPGKSSCYMCPSMGPEEIIWLYENEPHNFWKAIRLQDNAEPNLKSIVGLGRDYRWQDLIAAYRYINLIKKFGIPDKIPARIAPMMKKVKTALKKKNSNAKAIAVELFDTYKPIPCECFIN